MSDCEPNSFSRMECKACGLAMPPNGARRNCVALSSTLRAAPRIVFPRVAIGDLVEAILLRFGVSKELVERITRSPSCGCELRKAKLNMLGYRAQHSSELLANALADFFLGVR
jgi:hypothetical protein